ncbi:MAG: CcmD family protein [Bacteroidota bacterium]
MKTFQKYLIAFSIALLYFIPLLASAQNAQDVEMADTFRSDGKIYVVIGIMSIILAGLFIYLFMIGKKVSDLEKKIEGK